MELGATLRIWIPVGRPKEEFCGNWGASTSVLRGRSVAPLLSSPVPSAAISRILPMGCCCRDVGTIRLCIGIAWWVGLVASKEGFVFCCCIVLMVISDWGGITWGRGGEQDLWLTTSGSVLTTCTRGGGEEVEDEREWRKWSVFSLGERTVAGGEGLTRFTAEVVMGSLLCSKFKAEVFITCSGWPWCWVDPLVSCEGMWEMRRICCPPAIVWITFIGAWVWPLLKEIPFAVIGMKLAGLLGAAAWRMLTGVPPLVAGRIVGVWINVGWLLLPVCTKLTAPPTWPGVNIKFWGRATICPWPGREVNIFVGAQMLTGLCSLGLVTVVPRHICFGDGSSEQSGFKLRFRWLTAKREKVGNNIISVIGRY